MYYLTIFTDFLLNAIFNKENDILIRNLAVVVAIKWKTSSQKIKMKKKLVAY